MKLGALALGITFTTVTVVGIAAADPQPVDPLLKDVRAATSRYHAPEQAEKDGYVRDSPCESSPDGAMGFHYVNYALVGDPAIDPLHPEVLLYAPRANGSVELVGVEYFKVDDDGLLSTDADRPSFGSEPLNGPMPGHTPQMPVHYDLHVWIYQDNPSGTFAPWNPAVHC
jgi:hypothetical protein